MGYNSKSGELGLLTGVRKGQPIFSVNFPDGKYLYSVGEIDDERGELSSYLVDKENVSLNIINSISTGSNSPCHLMTDTSGLFC